MSQDARLNDEQSTMRRAQILNLQYYDTSQGEKPLYKDILSNEEIERMRVVVIWSDAHHIHFGVTNNTSQQTMSALRQRFPDYQVTFSLISDIGFREYLHLYNPPPEINYHDITLNQAGSEDQVRQASLTLEQVKADDMLAYLVQQAHKLGSSDIHIETQKDKSTQVRLRIDGVLHKIAQLPIDKYRVLISAIASAGNISTASHDAQQGHISQTVTMQDGSSVDVNVRLETVPTINGMDVVMRLFNMDQSMYNLDRLGLSEQQRAIVDDIIVKPSGLVLAVGPTGSGKTTTLYSVLNTLNSESRKIITIEDPVEYQFEGITQISVTSQNSQDTSFAEKLRAVLRLDPDVIMVGEIRDMDTARTALQASLTGHLVLSTFHASSASAALTRMMDVIGQNPLFVSAIRMVMAQRLVRKLDDNTKEAYDPDPATLQKIQAIVASLPADVPRPDLNSLRLYRPGASADNPYGYSGQVALREQFLMTGEIRKLLESGNMNLSAQTIEEAAIASGMKTLLQDGILRVIAGETTIEELARVLG